MSCFGHGFGEAAVSIINLNAIPGNDGNVLLSRICPNSPFGSAIVFCPCCIWVEVWDLHAPGLVDVGYVGSRLALDIQLGEGGLQRMTCSLLWVMHDAHSSSVSLSLFGVSYPQSGLSLLKSPMWLSPPRAHLVVCRRWQCYSLLSSPCHSGWSIVVARHLRDHFSYTMHSHVWCEVCSWWGQIH